MWIILDLVIKTNGPWPPGPWWWIFKMRERLKKKKIYF